MLFEQVGLEAGSLSSWLHEGLFKVRVAVALRLAVILHRMWQDGQRFQVRSDGGGSSVEQNKRPVPRSAERSPAGTRVVVRSPIYL